VASKKFYNIDNNGSNILREHSKSNHVLGQRTSDIKN
jgi:hypothetical protein